jgi:starch synthase (maltosyl-transferring)
MKQGDTSPEVKQKGRIRVVIERVAPEIDGGRFPIKRVIGERVLVEADVFADGHDSISALLLYRRKNDTQWTEVTMTSIGNDRWQGSFEVTELVCYEYTIMAWTDRFNSWQSDLSKKAEAGQDVSIDILAGARLLDEASRRAPAADAEALRRWAHVLESNDIADAEGKKALALSAAIARLINRYPDKEYIITYPKELKVMVDRKKAGFSSWYEMFPRSCATEPGRHGTLKDCEARLPYVASMGFDVLYLPPIHPIGCTNRKGQNNAATAGPDDPGTPWAIGTEEGGHKAVHSELGTLDDFRHLMEKAQEYNIEVALDLAFQSSPDHPYVKEHPEWFRWRPDGTIQYAENPPKNYQDIYPLDFQIKNWQALWEELKSIVFFWIEQGVRIFRVDNPHTKPFHFWEWLIAQVRESYPDVIFLSEAFTRPKVMYQLAKLGFTQSYTYFAWRNTKWELTQYFTELAQTEVREYYHPNLWPNTPDILTEHLQLGGRPAFMARLVLAATLGANYGIYGPAFELCENKASEPGSEEYLDSEKYEVKHWDISRHDSLNDFVGRINRVRHENAALQSDSNLTFHLTDNEQVICYSKRTKDFSNIVLVMVNLDPRYTQSGWTDLSLDNLGLNDHDPYQVHDLLTDARYVWHGSHNYVELNPFVVPGHIFRVRRKSRSEKNFDYYM